MMLARNEHRDDRDEAIETQRKTIQVLQENLRILREFIARTIPK
jgi:hypothetical protein